MHIILLEHPRETSPLHFNDIANTPLWSCLMTGYAGATLLHAGFEADIVDAARWTFPDTVEYLIQQPSDLLAIHTVYFWEKTEAFFQMLSELRKRHYAATICLYGFFPTLAWKDILDHMPAVDYVIVGEPEETLVDLALSLRDGTADTINGLAKRDQGKRTLTAKRPPIAPLDRLPFPLRPFLLPETPVSVLASRGCYSQCSFCLIPTLTGGRNPWRGRSVGNVAAEIRELIDRGKKDFYFLDPNFIGPGKKGRARVVELSEAFSGLGISFGMETRASDITSPIMRELVDAGLTSLLLGIESGSNHVLKRLAKHTSIAQNELAIAAVREAGLEPEIGFIMFDADSTLEDIAHNLKFLQRNRLLDRLGRTVNLLYHDHIAFKGTAGYESSLARGMLIPQGLFGFEGQLSYDDFRVGWLAELMKRVCHFLLKEMGRRSSSIHWSAESAEKEPYRAVNDHLVEIFGRLLSMAEALIHMPEESWTEELFFELKEELSQQIPEPNKGVEKQ